MKRYIMLILVLCLILNGCEKLSKRDAVTEKGEETINVDNPVKDGADESLVAHNEDDLSQSKDVAAFSEASVESLVRIGDNFLHSAFEGDIDKMLNLSRGPLVDGIEEDPEKYIGSKTEYTIDSIETTIKPWEDGTYVLISNVNSIKNDDKKKYSFKYFLTVRKVKNSYYIIDYDREDPGSVKYPAT